MNKNEIASQLADLGQEESRLHVEETDLNVQLAKNRQARRALARKRCKLLRDVACHPDTGLDPAVTAKANEPKDD